MWIALIAADVLSTSKTLAVDIDPRLVHYVASPCAVPKDAGYLRADGSIFVTGASLMKVPFGWNT